MKRNYFSMILAILFSYSFSHAQTPTSETFTNLPVKDSIKKNSVGIAVKPVRIDFHLSKGETSYQPIYITNNFGKTMQFKARIVDWMRDSVGGHAYTTPGTSPRSCAQWLSFSKDLIEIEPGKTGEILVRLKMPDSAGVADEMKWCLVFVESIAENKIYKPSDSARAHLRAIMRVGIHILQTPPSVMDKKDLQMISFANIPGTKNQYRILCQNTGKTQLECKSYIELSSLATGEKTTITAIEFPLFPDQKRYTDFVIPETLPKGKYTALGIVDAGEDDVPLQASEATIEIK